MRLNAEAKIDVQFHRIAFASAQFSVGSIAALTAFSADQKKKLARERLQDHDVVMSKKDPLKSKIYLIRKKHGFILAREGEDEHHIDDDETIDKINELITRRAQAGLELTELLNEKFPLTSTSNSFATHTTGAGDYDPQPKSERKRRKK